MDDVISRQAAIDLIESIETERLKGNIELIYAPAIKGLRALPPAQPEIIYCKDCRKHNKKVGFDENFHTVWKEDACPLVSWRGKAKGHEFDYQFCACGERREVTT